VPVSERRFLVEEQIKPDEDVEAHRIGKGKAKRGDEGTESDSDDFELHKKHAADEGGESSDDDVELHGRKTKL
jgi:hypothetical protein